jgi:ribonuclease E
MPSSSDDPPSAPPVESVEHETSSASRPSESAGNASDSSNPPGSAAQESEKRRPRRRRRRRPPLGSEAGATVAGGEAELDGTAPASDMAIVDGSQGAPPGEGKVHPPARRRRRRRRGPARDAASPPAPPAGSTRAGESVPAGEPLASAPAEDPTQSHDPQSIPARDDGAGGQPRRRRRRRNPLREQGSPKPSFGSESQSGSETVAATSPGEPATVRRPRTGRPRNRPPREAGSLEGQPPRSRAPARGRGAEPGGRSAREPDRRDRDPRVRGPGGRASRERQQGRGREAPRKRSEQKLYALESVVDRGFEDGPDETDDGVARRVHWTIIKRTVADQKSGKAMSAVYVLQREGVDSEFPNLGAARAAVNKTIVHPEKLTVSKAEHAAAKK